MNLALQHLIMDRIAYEGVSFLQRVEQHGMSRFSRSCICSWLVKTGISFCFGRLVSWIDASERWSHFQIVWGIAKRLLRSNDVSTCIFRFIEEWAEFRIGQDKALFREYNVVLRYPWNPHDKVVLLHALLPQVVQFISQRGQAENHDERVCDTTQVSPK